MPIISVTNYARVNLHTQYREKVPYNQELTQICTVQEMVLVRQEMKLTAW